MEELEHLERRRRGADVDGDHLVEAELVAQGREHRLVGLRDRRGELLRDLLAGLLEPQLR